MSWIKPASLDAARHHADRIASRFARVGISSSNLTLILAELGEQLPQNPGTDWLVMPPGRIDRLRTAALRVEELLTTHGDVELGGVDLARLRYILSEEVTG